MSSPKICLHDLLLTSDLRLVILHIICDPRQLLI